MSATHILKHSLMAPWAKGALAILTRQVSTSQEQVRGQYLGGREGRASRPPVPPSILCWDEVQVEALPRIAPLLHQLQRVAPPLAWRPLRLW